MAVVSPRATLGRDVEIGPFCVVEAGAELGDRCVLESHAIVKHDVVLGPENHLGHHAVLGGDPQHLSATDQLGGLVIGAANSFRESATVHRAMKPGNATTIGDGNFLMVNAHVGHDSHVGNHTILVNNVMLAGHVTIEDRAFLSGGAGIHQFCRVGTLAMVGGQARVSKDVPPYVLVDGVTTNVVGLNRVGLNRQGFTTADLKPLKDAYQVLYRSESSWGNILDRLRTDFPPGPAARFYEFCSSTKRGILQECRVPKHATLKIHRTDEIDPPQRMAG